MITVGAKVKVLTPVDGKNSVQFEIGKIIYIGRRALIEFMRNVCGHDGHGLGKNRHCWMCPIEHIKEV